MKENADSVVLLQVVKGRYKRPLTSCDFIHKIKKKDYKLCILTEDSLFNYYCK